MVAAQADDVVSVDLPDCRRGSAMIEQRESPRRLLHPEVEPLLDDRIICVIRATDSSPREFVIRQFDQIRMLGVADDLTRFRSARRNNRKNRENRQQQPTEKPHFVSFLSLHRRNWHHRPASMAIQ